MRPSALAGTVHPLPSQRSISGTPSLVPTAHTSLWATAVIALMSSPIGGRRLVVQDWPSQCMTRRGPKPAVLPASLKSPPATAHTSRDARATTRVSGATLEGAVILDQVRPS